MRPDRTGLGVTVALHALAAVVLFSYQPTRNALLAAAPIMVDLIAPPKEETKPEPPVELPRPKPLQKTPPRIEPLPLLAAAATAPSPVVAPPPPPAPPPPVEVAAAPPAMLTPPIFSADYLDNPKPAYPMLSLRLREQGTVVLRVLVNTSGGVDEVQVFKPSGYSRLDSAAQDAVQRWKFVPAKRGAESVSAWVKIPIPFVLN